MMKLGPLASPSARRQPAKAAPSGIAADKAAGTLYDIITQSINQPQAGTLLKVIKPFKKRTQVPSNINRSMSPSSSQVLSQDPIAEEGPPILFSQDTFQETVGTTIPS
jgi:hypothetical protein